MTRPSPDNLFVAIMIACGCAAVVTATDSWHVASVLIALLLAHLVLGFKLPGSPKLLSSLGLAVIFAYWWRSGSRLHPPLFLPASMPQMLALYTLTLATHHLMSRRNADRDAAAGASLIALSLSGFVRDNPYFAPLVAIYVTATLCYLRSTMRWPTLKQMMSRHLFKYAAAVALLLGMTLVLHRQIVRALPELSEWGNYRAGSASGGIGYSSEASLNSVERLRNAGENDQILLRVFSDLAPGYLRGSTFNTYVAGRWYPIEELQEIPFEGLPEGGRYVFPLSPLDVTHVAGTVYPERETSSVFFLPLGTQRLSAFSSTIRISDAFTVRPPRGKRWATGGYSYFGPTAGIPEPTPADLEVPDELRPHLEKMLSQLVLPDDDPRTVIEKVSRFSALGYTYFMGIELTGGKDPLLEFLQDIKEGHCEYFASAATLMLRVRNIPARYVTGFVCAEHVMGNRLYLSRRKDAHAWTEAYLPDAGWVTLDATPAVGQPQPLQTTRSEQWQNYFDALWIRLKNIFKIGGVGALFAMFWDGVGALMNKVPFWVWAVLFVIFGIWTGRARLRRLGWFSKRQNVSPRVRALRSKLKNAERIARKHGLQRAPHLTVSAFLEEVSRASIPEPQRTRVLQMLSEYQQQRFLPEPEE